MLKSRKVDSSSKQRAGSRGQKKLLPSQILELEAKKREEELNNLRKQMRQEQQMKFKEHAKTNSNHWRSSTKKKQIHGYSDMVLEHFTKEGEVSHSNPQSAQVKHRVSSSKGKENKDKIVTQGLNIKKKQPQNNSTSIEANFQKAMTTQNDDHSEVTDFLSGIKMEKYKEVFIDNGIEDKETILELNESHLEQMNLPLGHKLKIMKRIKESRKSQPGVAVQSEVQAQPAPVQNSVAAAVTIPQNTNNLLDGVYDEEANKREFQDALNAWRTVEDPKPVEEIERPQIKSQDHICKIGLKKKKSVRFAEASEELLILNNDEEQAENNEEEKEDNVATEMMPYQKPKVSITEGLVAFEGISITKNSFLFSEEANGSEFWNLGGLATVDHAGTSPRESQPIEEPKIVKPAKEL